jgi:hypothetical protein
MSRRAAAGLLLLALLAGCSGGERPTTVSTPSFVGKTPTASAAPSPSTEPTISRKLLEKFLKQGAERALHIYQTNPVGPRESRLITRLAHKIERWTGCEDIGYPGFLNAGDAGNFVMGLAQQGVPVDALVGTEGDTTEPSVLQAVKDRIKVEYKTRVTVKVAHIGVLGIAIDCPVEA